LACGGYFGGRWSSRFERWHPLRTYAMLECLIAIVALLVPLVLHSLAPAYQWIWKTTHASFVIFSLIRFALSALVLFVPTFLMGATLPVVSAFVSREPQLGGKRIGLLYACNTAGAVLGCAAAGLVLFPSIGLARTQWAAVALSLAAAAGAFALAARGKTARGDVGARTEAVRPGWRERLPELKSSKESAWLVALYAASGFIAMGYEVAWSSVLVLVLGSATYAYTIRRPTFLLGLA